MQRHALRAVQGHALRAVVAVLSVGVAGYSLLVVQRPLFAVVSVGAMVSTLLLYERGDGERTAVNAAIWAVLVAAFWSGGFRAVVVAVLFAVFGLLYWQFLRGETRAPPGSV